jgi:hypothetical protein
MTPILGIVLAVVLSDGANLRRCLLLVIGGAAAVVGVGWLLGLFVPYPVVAATNGCNRWVWPVRAARRVAARGRWFRLGSRR